ncbi:MAG: DUF6789 family protein [Octadecabacter sp.]
MDSIFAHLSNPLPLLIAGVVGTVILYIFMEVMAPKMLGAPMRPGDMICDILGCSGTVGHALHYLLGLVLFPLGYVIVAGILGLTPSLGLGVAWGVVLFLGAVMVVAPLSGRGMFFGAMKPTVAALMAHLFYGGALGVLI